MAHTDRIVILTGAGISAESGIATFRDQDGIWAKVAIEDVATPEAFRRNPRRVLQFYNDRRRLAAPARPNAAHEALASLEREHKGDVLLVTQNIDLLHEMAGSTKLIHMHGQINQMLCNYCRNRQPWGHNQPELTLDTRCEGCGRTGEMRPDVVWFGEMPYHMERIGEALGAADLFLSIGTSGNVYPAAGFVAESRAAGARCVELNLEPSVGASRFHTAIHGPASEIVPAFVDQILGRSQ